MHKIAHRAFRLSNIRHKSVYTVYYDIQSLRQSVQYLSSNLFVDGINIAFNVIQRKPNPVFSQRKVRLQKLLCCKRAQISIGILQAQSFVTTENACPAKKTGNKIKFKIFEKFKRFSISALTFSVLVNSWEQMVWTLVL